MPIASHGRRLLPRLDLDLDLPVRLGHHLARDRVVLDVRVAVNEALPLLAKLRLRHLDLAGAFLEAFKFLCHCRSLPVPPESFTYICCAAQTRQRDPGMVVTS